MKQVIKIKDIHLYVGITANAAECYTVKKFLDETGVAYTLLQYIDDQHAGVFSALSTWNWGRLENPEQRQIADFPVVTWKEIHDDYEHAVYCATSLHELKNSRLLVHLDKADKK
jgi:hypothetical protein